MKNYKMFFLSVFLISNVVFAEPKLLNQIVAIVNDDVILDSDVRDAMSLIKFKDDRYGEQLLNNNELYKIVLGKEIVSNIALQFGYRMGFRFSNENLDDFFRMFFLRSGDSYKDFFESSVKKNRNYDGYKKKFRDEVFISGIYDSMLSHLVNIHPEELNSIENDINIEDSKNAEFQLVQVLIPVSDNETQQQIKNKELLANDFVKKFKNSINVSNKNKKNYGNSEISYHNGMKWIKISKLPSLFSKILIKSKKGDIFGPIRSDAGFHILKVNNVRGLNSKTSLLTLYHMRHILFKTPQSDFRKSPLDEEIHNSLTKLSTDILDGKISFFDAAKKYSDDKSSADRGGDLGWLSFKQVSPIFGSVVLGLTPGQFSPLVRTNYGWEFIQLLDVRRTKELTKKLRKLQLYRFLFNKKYSSAVKSLFNSQHFYNYVKILEKNAQ